MLPKYTLDFEETIEEYYKLIKKCRNKIEITEILGIFYSHVAHASILEHEIKNLQEKAKELEFNIKLMCEDF